MRPERDGDGGNDLAFAVLMLILVALAAAGGGLKLTNPPKPHKPRDARPAPTAPGFPPGDASLAAWRGIPRGYLRLYVGAAGAARRQGCRALSWQVLAGIGSVESNHGRLRAPGVRSGANFAGAAGPMQFGIGGKAGNTWGGSRGGGPRHPAPPRGADPGVWGAGVDGSGDRVADVYDPRDAIPAAAGKLCRDGLASAARVRRDKCPQLGGSAGLHQALWAYNHACSYVGTVLDRARRYTGRVDGQVGVLVARGRITTTTGAGCRPDPDLDSGRLDRRVHGLLAEVGKRHRVRISCLRSGHSRYVKGTRRVSNHTVWRAVDLDRVDGGDVGAGNGAAHRLVQWLNGLQGELRPSEIGSPWVLPGGLAFSDEGHQGHVHVGYRAR
jgi:hypothetical protein